MSKFELANDYLYMRKAGKITISSVDPMDKEYLELTDVGAEMFELLVEKNLEKDQVIKAIQNNYSAVDLTVIQRDLDDLISVLVNKKILIIN